MDLISDLEEVSYQDSFKWRINNIPQPNMRKEFIIKSKEKYFKKADAMWCMQLNLVKNDTPVRYFSVTFFLFYGGLDVNATYKFGIRMGDKLIMESPFVAKPNKSTTEPLEFRFNANQCITLRGEDFMELEPFCIVETLQHLTNVHAILKDSDEEPEPEEKQAESVDEKVASKVETENAEIVVSTNSPLSSSGSKMKSDFSDSEDDISEASNTKATMTERIRDIYLEKMWQVAKNSAELTVASAHLQLQPLLKDCCASLAAQITPHNFNEIWNIAQELKAEDLKQLVVKWVAENPQQLNKAWNYELIEKATEYQEKN